MARLCHGEIDERGLARPTPEIEQERRVAIFDLSEDTAIALPPRDGCSILSRPKHASFWTTNASATLDIDLQRPISRFPATGPL